MAHLYDQINTSKASTIIKEVSFITPLIKNFNASEEHQCNIFLKREDLQSVRSYKIRGAYNKISSIPNNILKNGVVCASAGNHAQGVALSCAQLKVKCIIFMPTPTPQQKIEQVKMFGKDFVEVRIEGDTFDDAKNAALAFCSSNKMEFVHPFDDLKIIEGQSTVAKEILEQINIPIDYVFLPLGGGGLASGVSAYFKKHSPNTKIIAVEPEGAASYNEALKANSNIKLDYIDKFIDGAAVQQVGNLTFEFCKQYVDNNLLINEGKVCSTILKLYNKDAIVVEPAGALSLAALDQFKEEIIGKNVVCILSGSNNDITRMEEIKERSMLHDGLKHYFLVDFPQRPGALKEFVNDVLGPNDDITHFEYVKKHNREKGPVNIGIELKNKLDFDPLIEKMKTRGFIFKHLNNEPNLLNTII